MQITIDEPYGFSSNKSHMVMLSGNKNMHPYKSNWNTSTPSIVIFVWGKRTEKVQAQKLFI